MGPRYTKAIILLVVGSPVLAAGIIIDNSLETNTAQSSTVTIARLMIAVGACMVAVGVFICCIIMTTNKKEEPNTPSPPGDIQLHRVRVTTAPHSQSQRRGVQLVTYSPLPEAQGNPYPPPQSARFNRTPLVNSPAVHFQTSAVTSTPVNHSSASHLTRASVPTGNVSQLPNAILPTQNGGQHANPSTVPNQIPSMPAVHSSISETKSQRSNTSEAKSQRSNTSVAKSQRSNNSENKSQRSSASESKSQRSHASEAKSQRSNPSEAKSQRVNITEAKTQRSSPSDAKSHRTNNPSEGKSHKSSSSETKSKRSSSSEARNPRSNSSEARNPRSSSSETKNQRTSSSEAKSHRSSSSETKNQRSNPSPGQNKRSSTSENPSKCTGNPDNSNLSLQQHNPGPQNNTHQRHLSSESLVYPVSATDMAKLLTAAKKVMDPKSFDDIAKAYSIVYSSSRPTSQVDMPAFDYSVPAQGPLSSCSSASAGQLSTQAAGACCLLPATQEQMSLENTLPLGSSPSAPPYQEQPPEFDPPPYCP
ncbi:uncharacterized protein LOC135224351 isoform X1 [Macrobrachium nipponense]|uniref:uncharacterized protein LOC135224351 isoform X1 n=1 Tax=Macrobrachium nipponense TaxID=159736 RepID=UPI0030C84CC8